MKRLAMIASALLLAASAHAISVDGPLEVMQSLGSPSSDFWDDPGYTTSPDFIIGPPLHYLSEVVQAWRSDGMGMVAFNDTSLTSDVRSNNVGAYFSGDFGQTWQSHEALSLTLRGFGTFKYSSDPCATTYTDAHGHVRFALGAVALAQEFAAAGYYDCNADTAMVIATTQDSARWSPLRRVPSPPGDRLLEDRPMLIGDGRDLWAMYNAVGNGTGIECDDETAELWFTRSSDGGVTWTPATRPRTQWAFINGTTHMAPSNIIVDHGKLLFAFFGMDKNIHVFRCAVDGFCTVLSQSGVGFNPAPDDHFHVGGLPSTRLNSDPVIACDSTRTRCIVAWMDVDPATPTEGRIRVMSTPNAQDTAEPSPLWTHPAQLMPRGATQGSQLIPSASWDTDGKAMLCWYQQLGLFPDPASGSLDYVCTSSIDGVRWRPVQIVGHTDIGNATSLGTNFLGDYNGCGAKAGKCVFTGQLWEHAWPLPSPPPGQSNWRKRPIVMIADYNPDSCAIVPGSGGGAWLLVAPLVWVVRRRAAVIALALLLAAPMHATCMGDCDDNGEVRIEEVVTMVNIALGDTALDACPVAIECDDTGLGVYVPCLVEAVGAALEGCPEEPAP